LKKGPPVKVLTKKKRNIKAKKLQSTQGKNQRATLMRNEVPGMGRGRRKNEAPMKKCCGRKEAAGPVYAVKRLIDAGREYCNQSQVAKWSKNSY